MSEMRTEINTKLKDAMREKSQIRLSTLRLINAAIKDRDIADRSKGNSEGISDDMILALLQSMVKQRRESSQMYKDANRAELAKREEDEIEIIQEFLPKQLAEDEVLAVIEKAIEQTGASSIKDMGKIMGHLKEHYTGQIDMSKAGGLVKTKLG